MEDKERTEELQGDDHEVEAHKHHGPHGNFATVDPDSSDDGDDFELHKHHGLHGGF